MAMEVGLCIGSEEDVRFQRDVECGLEEHPPNTAVPLLFWLSLSIPGYTWLSLAIPGYPWHHTEHVWRHTGVSEEPDW